MMNKTKIEWCDITWNPVWGCKNNCSYCYARKIAKRFAGIKGLKETSRKIHEKLYYTDLRNDVDSLLQKISENLYSFKPTWLESNFQKKFPKKPSRIFVNSMSDIKYWKDEWMKRVLEKIREYSQHTFMFLTKDTSVYEDYDFPENCWLGYTFTTQERFNKFYFGDNDYFPEKNKLFISIEPIQEPIQLKFKVDWLIIGAETGNRKGKIVTERKWIENLIDDCKGENNIPIFLKDNLKSVWGDELIQEFPKKCIQDKK